MASRILIKKFNGFNMPTSKRKNTMQPLSKKFLSEVTRTISPKFDIREKSNPTPFMKIISFFVSLFNKRFNTGYITVIAGTMWVPEGYMTRAPDISVVELLAHETMHELDRKKLGTFLFSFLYLTPQTLAVLSLLSLLAIWFSNAWLFCLLFLLCLAPIPSPARMHFELRGYRTNVFFMRHVDKISEEELPNKIEYILQQFTGPYYYFMWPFKKHLIKNLLDRSCESDPYFVLLRTWLTENNLIKK